MDEELREACKQNDIKTVKLKLKDIDINRQYGIEKISLLMIATLFKNFEIVKILIKNGANPNIKNNNRITAYKVAYINNDREIMEFLIENGAEPNIENEY